MGSYPPLPLPGEAGGAEWGHGSQWAATQPDYFHGQEALTRSGAGIPEGASEGSLVGRGQFSAVVTLYRTCFSMLQNEGLFTAGPRFILELRPFISDICGEEVPLCKMCNEPVIQV